ncbi:hypothetical protein A7982_12670 [Minicystis rosea]|nr:hypothetical protein A7982_12670 [Minicystis rosea]
MQWLGERPHTCDDASSTLPRPHRISARRSRRALSIDGGWRSIAARPH